MKAKTQIIVTMLLLSLSIIPLNFYVGLTSMACSVNNAVSPKYYLTKYYYFGGIWPPPAFYSLGNDKVPELYVKTIDGIAVIDLYGSKQTLHACIYTCSYSFFSVYDIDRDGEPEVILLANKTLKVWDLKRQTAEFEIRGIDDQSGSAFLADITGDSIPELVVVNGGNLSVISMKERSTVWFLSCGAFRASATNLDGDEGMELVICTTAESQGTRSQLLVVDNNGKLIWSRPLPEEFPYGIPVVYDLNHDKHPDAIIAGSSGLVVVDLVDRRTLWSFDVAEISLQDFQITFPPFIADVDGDGKPEIVVAGRKSVLVVSSSGRLVFYSRTIGTVLHFPYMGLTAADVDGDRQIEVLVPTTKLITVLDVGDEMCYRGISGTWSPVAVYSILAVDCAKSGKLDLVIVCWDFIARFSSNEAGYRIYLGDPSFNGTWNPNYLLIDPDADCVSTYTERLVGTDPYKEDSDGDGYLDGCEMSNGMDPLGKNFPPYPLWLKRHWPYVMATTPISLAAVACVVFIARRRGITKH